MLYVFQEITSEKHKKSIIKLGSSSGVWKKYVISVYKELNMTVQLTTNNEGG